MKTGVIGMVFSIIIATLMLIVAPIYYIGITESVKSSHAVLSETRNLIDEVIDTRVLTDDMIADYNLALASLSTYYKSTIYREIKIVNPDPAHPGLTYTSYVVTDDFKNYQQGDIITVQVDTVGLNLFQVVSRRMLGLSIREDELTLSARVR